MKKKVNNFIEKMIEKELIKVSGNKYAAETVILKVKGIEDTFSLNDDGYSFVYNMDQEQRKQFIKRFIRKNVFSKREPSYKLMVIGKKYVLVPNFVTHTYNENIAKRLEIYKDLKSQLVEKHGDKLQKVSRQNLVTFTK